MASFYLFIFSSLCISLSDRSRKVGAKNRQLPNERQLSGDQLQEGPDRRIRCNRPMSTVQHLCPFSVSFSSRPPCNFSRGVKGEKTREEEKKERKGARVVFVSFAGIRTKAVPEIAPVLRAEWKAEWDTKVSGRLSKGYRDISEMPQFFPHR